MANKVKTPNQFRGELRDNGMTLKEWAAIHDFDYLNVCRVISGSSKALYGDGHTIAVAMGIKPKPEIAA